MTHSRSRRTKGLIDARRQRGFSLIELMLAMLIGILVTTAAAGIFMSNRRVYGSIETVSRIQENARVAFEMMSRDLREAGGNPCAANGSIVNQLTTGDNAWWTAYAAGVTGYESGTVLPGIATGAAAGQRVAATDAIDIHGARDIAVRVTAHATPNAAVTVSSVAGIANGDVMMVCNPDFGFVFQVTGIAGSALAHNGGLNCNASFRDERPAGACMGAAQRSYCFGSAANVNCNAGNVSPAMIGRVMSTRWYVANNARGGTSLFRDEVVNVTGANAANGTRVSTVEVVDGVNDMQVTWLLANTDNYADANTIANWNNVVAARITLVLSGTEGALSARDMQGTDGQALTRTITNIVTLRNREALL